MRTLIALCLLVGMAGAQEQIVASGITSNVHIAQPYEQFAIGGRIYTICQLYGYCVPTVEVPLPTKIPLVPIVIDLNGRGIEFFNTHFESDWRP